MLEPDDSDMGGISDDDELYGSEREYAIMSPPPKGNTRMTSSVLFFIILSSNPYLSLRVGKKSKTQIQMTW
jgi:hypothetical protein